MLSGLAPFYSRPRQDTANSIMRRIKEGDFRMDGEAWRCVSSQAKTLCKGLLTVDHRKRISIDQLGASQWVQQAVTASHSHICPPTLMTSALLLSDPSTEQCIKQTYDAFHNATRDGFRLIPVTSSLNSSSKLLQKRKLKQSTSTETISSLSDRSSLGSKSSSSSTSGGGLTAASAKHWASAVHGGTSSAPGSGGQLKHKDGGGSEVFSFKPSQVSDYLANFARTAVGTSNVGATPLNLPLSINVSSYSSHVMSMGAGAHHPGAGPVLSYPPLGGGVVTASHHHQHQPPPYHHHAYRHPLAVSAANLPPTTAGGPLSLPNSAVSLSIISPPVIASSTSPVKSSSTRRGQNCTAGSNCTSCSPSAAAGNGPVTRSRKRKLCEMDNSTAPTSQSYHQVLHNHAANTLITAASGKTTHQTSPLSQTGHTATYTADITLATAAVSPQNGSGVAAAKNFLEPLNLLQHLQQSAAATSQMHNNGGFHQQAKHRRQGTITIE
jgi:hypothetical protein